MHDDKIVYKVSPKFRHSKLQNKIHFNMTRSKSETTSVTGYFNPQKYAIYIEIPVINLKTELAPNAYVLDQQGRHINDPIFEPYCHPKGLARAKSETPIPINYMCSQERMAVTMG